MAEDARTKGRLAGRVALVTGASRPIGKAIALELAREGAAVAVAANRGLDAVEAVAREICDDNGCAVALQADVTRRAEAEALIARTLEALGGLDILVNNAGFLAKAPLERVAAEDWARTFAVNIDGPFFCAVAAARHMKARGGGSIVNIAGASAHRSFPGAGAYGPSKAALVNLTQQMALEWAADAIRVNGVSPGPIRPADDPWREREPALVRQVGKLPLGRVGTPEDVAKAVLYLASDDAAYVTGQMLIVDGGSVATWYLQL